VRRGLAAGIHAVGVGASPSESGRYVTARTFARQFSASART
jgi:hypothetical protein